MTADDGRAPAEFEEIIVALLGRYIERREAGLPPLAHDLLAAAGEFGASAVDGLRSVLVFYESTRALESTAGRRRSGGRGRTPRDPMPESAHDSPSRLESVSVPQAQPTIAEVLRFEDLPLGSRGSRRAVVRWSGAPTDTNAAARTACADTPTTRARPRSPPPSDATNDAPSPARRSGRPRPA